MMKAAFRRLFKKSSSRDKVGVAGNHLNNNNNNVNVSVNKGNEVEANNKVVNGSPSKRLKW